MSQPSRCPHCGVPLVVTEGSRDESEDLACAHCGRPLPHDAPASPRRPTVLCIDDDPLALYFYRDFLARHGYRVRTATEGLPGLALAQRERPDVVLLDVMLRGLSGYDICRKFRADPTLRDIPIILITVWDHPSVVTTGRAAGATRTLQKPTDPETVLAAVAQVLGEPTRRPTAGA